MLNNDRILVADDHEIVRMGMLRIIKQLKPQAHLAEVNDYISLYSAISKDNYDLVILDVNMPNGSFQDAVVFIKLKQPSIKILVFSSQDEQIYAVRYLKLGADGYLNKESSSAKIDQALSAMLSTGRYLSDEVRDAMISASLNGPAKSTPIAALSNRELQIANKLVEGIPLKELSNTLNLHASTISTYKNRLFEKLNIKSIPELVEILKLYKE
ncbi:response regulator [Flavobacterium sp. TMP13]|uniref:response regulator n=1 Tax=Flavobacterium sp. TMP13 TaxID=3425950 RepID=UPI003D782FBC